MTEQPMEPGPYSVFVLRDDGTWVQPTYLVGDGWTEERFGREAEARNGGFVYYGIGRDEDAPEDTSEPMGDFA